MASPSTRPSLARYQRIIAELKSGRRVTAAGLAAQLGVSTKTVYRDLEFIRDGMKLPLEYDPVERTHGFTRQVEALPGLEFSEEEVLALLVARRTLEQFRQTPLQGPLESAFRKLAAPLSAVTRAAPGVSGISIHTGPVTPHDGGHYAALARAIVDQREIAFTYTSPKRGATQRPRLEPYHLFHRGGTWYLVARDPVRGVYRTFAVARIGELRVRARTFARDPAFSIESYLQHAIAVGTGGPPQRVTLAFDAFAANYVRGRQIHPSQVWRDGLDGTGHLTLETSDFIEVERLVLQWGGHAEALGPAWLRGRLERIGRTLSERHRPAGPPPEGAPAAAT